MNKQEQFETWAIVELFGHNVIAGMVTEQTIGGVPFIRVDVPEVEEYPAFTKFFNGSAIYAMTPTGEAEVREATRRLRVRPIQPWVVPALSLPNPSDNDEDAGDDDNAGDYRYPERW